MGRCGHCKRPGRQLGEFGYCLDQRSCRLAGGGALARYEERRILLERHPKLERL